MSLVDATDPTVLHVDDDPALGRLVKTYLEREASGLDCTVTVETAPGTALARLQAADSDLDCIITDYEMPEMNGIEFLEAVRESHPELPVVLFSGRETAEIAPEIIESGLTDYLRKGAGTDQYTILLRRVEHAVDSGGRFDASDDVELGSVGLTSSHG
jgi:CheY-like chemotaxis protein